MQSPPIGTENPAHPSRHLLLYPELPRASSFQKTQPRMQTPGTKKVKCPLSILAVSTAARRGAAGHCPCSAQWKRGQHCNSIPASNIITASGAVRDHRSQTPRSALLNCVHSSALSHYFCKVASAKETGSGGASCHSLPYTF